MMPGELEGMGALSQLRERFPSLPVIMMRGRAELSDAVRATKLGAFHFLEQPLTHEAMLLSIRSALELRQARREAKTLRASEAKEIERVGGGKPIPVNVRIVAATNKDLEKNVAEGSFREELYFRLYVIPMQVPPLRDRVDDIDALVLHFSALG